MATNAGVTRMLNDREIPSPRRWSIDRVHSEVSFVARHMMISKVRGRFREFSGAIDAAANPEESSVEVTINAASIDTGDADRDRHLRSQDCLDVNSYPEILFDAR